MMAEQEQVWPVAMKYGKDIINELVFFLKGLRLQRH
jgi:hypothetical protein